MAEARPPRQPRQRRCIIIPSCCCALPICSSSSRLRSAAAPAFSSCPNLSCTLCCSAFAPPLSPAPSVRPRQALLACLCPNMHAIRALGTQFTTTECDFNRLYIMLMTNRSPPTTCRCAAVVSIAGQCDGLRVRAVRDDDRRGACSRIMAAAIARPCTQYYACAVSNVGLLYLCFFFASELLHPNNPPGY